MQEQVNAEVELQNLKDGYTPAMVDLTHKVEEIEQKIDKILELI